MDGRVSSLLVEDSVLVDTCCSRTFLPLCGVVGICALPYLFCSFSVEDSVLVDTCCSRAFLQLCGVVGICTLPCPFCSFSCVWFAISFYYAIQLGSRGLGRIADLVHAFLQGCSMAMFIRTQGIGPSKAARSWLRPHNSNNTGIDTLRPHYYRPRPESSTRSTYYRGLEVQGARGGTRKILSLFYRPCSSY